MIRTPRVTSAVLALIASFALVAFAVSCAEAEETTEAALEDARALAPVAGTQLAANPCNPCNPCAKKNPCNPCGANPCNPCGAAAIDASRIRQPAGVTLASAPRAELLGRGEQLWNDRALGKTGLACGSCHQGHYAQMNASFAKPYPHRVGMPYAQAGLEQVNAAEMVNFCMVAPMGSEPLDWSSKDLAALAAYVEHIQPGFNPCAAKAAGNPCNPCAMKNPCNPCGAD